MILISYICDKRNSETEEEEAETDGEEPPVLEKLVRPVVDHPSDEGLHVAKLGVDAQHQQHHEEDGGPQHRAGQG